MIDNIVRWFDKADPSPTRAKLNTQIGVHLEECGEFLTSLQGTDQASNRALLDLHHHVSSLADALKAGICHLVIADRTACLDAICDQIVTATGVGAYAGLNVELGLSRVVASNWSKFDANGNPIFKENGKIAKGPDYAPPDLRECV